MLPHMQDEGRARLRHPLHYRPLTITMTSREGRWHRFTYYVPGVALSVLTNVCTFIPDNLAEVGIFTLVLQIKTLQPTEMT